MKARDIGLFSQDVSIGQAADSLPLVEMANLRKNRTGIDGIIYVSTQQGNHPARIKWYPVIESRDSPCLSVGIQTPNVLNHGLSDQTRRQMEPVLVQWVRLNQTDLLDFWDNGFSWDSDRVQAFIRRLRKIRA